MEDKKNYILLTVKEDSQEPLLLLTIDTIEEIKVLNSLFKLRNERNIVLLESIHYGEIALENQDITVSKIIQSFHYLINKKVIIPENNYYKFNEEYIIFP